MREKLFPQLIEQLSLESVQFQSLTFFKELVNLFVSMQEVKKADLPDHSLVGDLMRVITHHTGLNVAVHLGDLDPSVEIPNVNRNNPLVNSFIRNYISSADGLELLAKNNGMVRGSVSLKTGKVTGIFTEVKSKINMPLHMFTTKKFLPEEIAAVLLHEVGHLFVYYEFMARAVTTNQSLAALSKALDGSTGAAEREVVLLSAKKALNLAELDVKQLAQSGDKKVTEVVVVSNVVKQIESEIGSNIYDFNTWEYLADQYVARYGAGRHLVLALEKIYRGSWNKSFRSLPVYLALEATKAVLVVAGVLTAPTFITFGIMLMAMDASHESYDDPGARIKRVRNQIVENLKDPKLSKDDTERLQADLSVIDDLLSQVTDRRQWISALWDAVHPGARKARSQAQLQQELEAIAANDLFIKAAALNKLV